MKSKLIGTLAATFVLAGALVAVAAPSDAWITTKTKMALLTSDNVGATRVNVDTMDGRVTLHGSVNTTAEKAEAERVAKGIEGVKSVRNLLQVVAERRSDAAKASDSDLKPRVEKALNDDKALADSDIAVASVNDGVVLLKGDAKSLDDHLRAVECAAAVPGVRRVASEIKSPDKMGDAEIYRDREPDAADVAEGKISDGYVTSAVKMKLMADDRVPGLDVNVDTRGGQVTLFGMVPSKESKAAAEEIAKGTSGVRSVKNELQVVAEQRQEAVKASDDQIQERVEQAIKGNSGLKDANIDVEVENGVARLSGTVERPEQRMTAAVVAREAKGVRAVKQDLRVSN